MSTSSETDETDSMNNAVVNVVREEDSDVTDQHIVWVMSQIWLIR